MRRIAETQYAFRKAFDALLETMQAALEDVSNANGERPME